VPIQFDLCKPLLEAFSAQYGIPLRYSPSYYEDLKYRVSANDLRTAMGSDCVVVGGGLSRGFELVEDADGYVVNEFGMKMRQGPLYMEVVESPLRDVSSIADVERYQFPDPHDPARYVQAEADIARYKQDYFIIAGSPSFLGINFISRFSLSYPPWYNSANQSYVPEGTNERERRTT